MRRHRREQAGGQGIALLPAPIGDEKVQKPQICAVIVRVRGKKILVEVDRAVVVRCVPVEIRAVFGVKNSVVCLFAVGIQLKRLTGEG